MPSIDPDTPTPQSAETAGGVRKPPAEMKMTFQRGMLKTLGINLYASIGKVLVEFVANAYDSDATRIDIDLPADRIYALRESARAARRNAKAAAKAAADGASAPVPPAGATPQAELDLDGLTTVLSEDVVVTITDDGHGMTWQEVEEKFLPLNRARRRDTHGHETRLTSPGGRYVMGRKGVGKLAGFGAAGTVVLRTKRAGETYATLITMSDSTIDDERERGADIKIPVAYETGLPAEDHGTRITLSNLKADAFKSSIPTIAGTVASAFFAIRETDFHIVLNGATVKPDPPSYEFVYPESLSTEAIAAGQMTADSFDVPDIGTVPFSYYVGFWKRSSHLPASKRGARIYCNNRLAAGPTLFSLGTGMHSFHSVDYMDCIVEANALDRGSVDLISTSRTQLQEGNDVFDALQAKVVEIMRAAIARHGAFREAIAREEIDADPVASMYRRSLATLPRGARAATGKLLDTMAAQYGVDTPEFRELAPVILNSVNAAEVLGRLVSINTKAETIRVILGQLHDLSEIEAQDVLKLYRGRRGGIAKLQRLEIEGNDLWKRKGMEKELHSLLKENPWLIRPEFSNYVTSDEQMNSVASKIASRCGVDAFAPVMDGADPDLTRPDLVFVMSDRGPEGPHVIKVIELKSPSLPLSIEHFRQLEDYILVIEGWCQTELRKAIPVQGYLIGAMPPDNATARGEKLLLQQLTKQGPDSSIRVTGLTSLINDARNIHLDAIVALEKQLGDDDQDAAASPAPELVPPGTIMLQGSIPLLPGTPEVPLPVARVRKRPTSSFPLPAAADKAP